MALDDECPLCAAKAVDRQKDREYQIVGDYKLACEIVGKRSRADAARVNDLAQSTRRLRDRPAARLLSAPGPKDNFSARLMPFHSQRVRFACPDILFCDAHPSDLYQ